MPRTLQRNAETAMYEAKRTGRPNYVLSSEAPTRTPARELHFVTRLRKAVEAQRWTLTTSRSSTSTTGAMVGVEALIRWIEPDGTIVPPNDFIPLAEELGLIEQIGDWVVRELTYQVSAWQELDIDLEVGFNLSPRQFWQPDLADRIQREFRAGGVDPSQVLVEVTETSAMMDPDRAQVDPARAHRRRVLDRDRRLRDRVLVALAAARHAGARPEDRPLLRQRACTRTGRRPRS